jgi:phage host-nuclease inhibitor protein Gam
MKADQKKVEADKERDQADLRRTETNLEAKMDDNKAATRSICDAWLTDLKDGRNEMTTC